MGKRLADRRQPLEKRIRGDSNEQASTESNHNKRSPYDGDSKEDVQENSQQ